MKNVQLTDREVELLVLALQVRACYIETGTPILTANEAIAQGKQNLVKALEPSQHKILTDSSDLIRKLHTRN